jgi:hypothetical protein
MARGNASFRAGSLTGRSNTSDRLTVEHTRRRPSADDGLRLSRAWW